MEQDTIFSVIIPVYNAAEYLPDTLKNMPSGDNMRYIFVDDGSGDNTCKIIADYCQTDKRAVYIQKNHEGVSSARNAGLEVADGDYILFMDGDDGYIGDISVVLPPLTAENPDIVVFGARVINYNAEYVVNNITPRDIIYRPFAPDALFSEVGSLPYVWNCAYKRQFLLDNGIKFNIQTDIGEDLIFQFTAMPKAGCIRFASDILYCYKHLKRRSLINDYEGDLSLRVKKHIELVDMIWSEWQNDSVCRRYIDQFAAWIYIFLRPDFRRLKGKEYGIYAGQLKNVFKNRGVKIGKLKISFKRKLRLHGLTHKSCRLFADYVKKS